MLTKAVALVLGLTIAASPAYADDSVSLITPATSTDTMVRVPIQSSFARVLATSNTELARAGKISRPLLFALQIADAIVTQAGLHSYHRTTLGFQGQVAASVAASEADPYLVPFNRYGIVGTLVGFATMDIGTDLLTRHNPALRTIIETKLAAGNASGIASWIKTRNTYRAYDARVDACRSYANHSVEHGIATQTSGGAPAMFYGTVTTTETPMHDAPGWDKYATSGTSPAWFMSECAFMSKLPLVSTIPTTINYGTNASWNGSTPLPSSNP